MTEYDLMRVRELICKPVEYIKGEGAWCPVCALFNTQSRLYVTNTEGDGLRYCACRNCKFSFKTIEKTYVGETLEPLATNATVPQYKNRKRRKK
jgi:hypothetical protein